MCEKENTSSNSIITLISKNRTELMGVATIAVFFLHILAIADISILWFRKLMKIPVEWLMTPGFLFLSGFSIFFSLEKDSRFVPFIKKRIKRLYIPFLIIAGPFLTFLSIHQGDNLWMLFARLSTVNFWIEGNFCGMWYVSVIMLLYILSPFVFRFMNTTFGYFWWFGIFTGLLFILISYPWAPQMPAFLMGMLVAKMKDENPIGISACLLFVIILEPVFSLFAEIAKFSFLPEIFHRLSFIVLFTFFFSYLKNASGKMSQGILHFVTFFGKHSLELYLLHILIYDSFRVLELNTPTVNIFLAIGISVMVCKPIKIFADKMASFVL